MDNVMLLDCTLRDGGLGLEDNAKSDSSEQGMTESSLRIVKDRLLQSGIDIIELGSIEITANDKRCFSIYKDIESVSKLIVNESCGQQMYAALYRGPDTPISDIPDYNENLCSAVRVIIRYSEMQKSLDFCRALCEKGYKVFIQPMLTMRYTEDEIQLLIDEANSMNAYALYFVDSYGYMRNTDVDYYFERYNEGLDPKIFIGFHSHNNMNLAYSNVLRLLDTAGNRKIIIDSCATGMGQGAGNLQTELIVPYLNENCDKQYNFDAVLSVCDEIEKYSQCGKWGYSVTRLIPALNKVAYKYSAALRVQYGLTYSEINNIFKNIPEDLRHRYTPENTVQLLKRTGFNNKIGGNL